MLSEANPTASGVLQGLICTAHCFGMYLRQHQPKGTEAGTGYPFCNASAVAEATYISQVLTGTFRMLARSSLYSPVLLGTAQRHLKKGL